jgi:hypothetical protein
MYDFSSQANLIIQGCLAVILIGVFYNLWSSTKMYGGLIGTAVRFLGLGMLFVTIGVIERIIINFNVVAGSANVALIQDVLTLIGLILLGIGFSKLAAATKA